MGAERDAAVGVEAYALALEQGALEPLGAGIGARADLAARIDHAMPRHARVAQRRQRVADLPCLPGQPGELGDLPIRGDAATGNPPHRGIDAGPARVRRRHGRESTRTASPTAATPAATTRQ